MKARLRALIALALVAQAMALIGSQPVSALSMTTVPGEIQANDDTPELLTSEYALAPPTVTVDVDDTGPMGAQIPDEVALPATAADVSLITKRQCRKVTVTLNYHLRGSDHVAFYFRLGKEWCWNPNTHKVVSWNATPSGHVYSWATPSWSYEGVTDSNDFYYQYFSGIPNSGHYSYRAGKFQAHCGPWHCGSRNPKIIIRGHGDGTFTYWTKG